MRFRLPGAPTLVASLLGLIGAACSGGGAGSDIVISTACDGADANFVCLDSCSLGCHGQTCEITDIAQNENIVLHFSQALDPLYVTTSTIQFRTATGDVPVGDFLVNGGIVEFVPRVLTVGSQSFFGFQAGETYTMTLPGGAGETSSVRSTSGDPLKERVTCTLRVTRGIVDHNQVPPRAEMVLPTTTQDVPLNTAIQLRFNELIDATPFLSGTSADSPVGYGIARTLLVGGQRVCNPEFSLLAGSVRLDLVPEEPAAYVTFVPTDPLPGNSCVRITVTDRVHDLSGRAAETQLFEFKTIETAVVEEFVLEEFTTDTQLDVDRSAGTWSGGTAIFAPIGGDGRHGSFDLTSGGGPIFVATIGGFRVFRIDTSNTVIPARNTISGASLTVTDGRFFYSDMVVPADVRLVFTGASPPQFTVRGRLQVDGIIDVRGEGTNYFNPPSGPPDVGQPGGLGGVFGGAGGAGGTRSDGLNAAGDENGSNGQDCRVLAGHSFAAQVAGTGGRGSVMFPTDGRNASLVYPPLTISSNVMQSAAGGGGGGLQAAGGTGRAVSNPVLDPILLVPPRLDFLGPQATGGNAFPLLPVPGGVRSSLHFLVGGSGGGGGGSHALLLVSALVGQVNGRWAPGCGGGGGGGAVALRAGNLLRIATVGDVLATGGSAGISPTAATALSTPAPGGGGSGGSIVLQCAGQAQILGEVNVRGGSKGIVFRQSSATSGPHAGFARTEGGDGAPGVLRLEVAGTPTTALLPNAQPPATSDNVGSLTEVDTRVGFQSLFYSTGYPFGPDYVRYEIRALIDGQPVLFSDDISVGIPARAGFGPLEAFWQAGKMDLATQTIDQNDLAQRVWRLNVGTFGGGSLAADGRNAFRFLLVLDRTNGQSVVIESVKVIYRV